MQSCTVLSYGPPCKSSVLYSTLPHTSTYALFFRAVSSAMSIPTRSNHADATSLVAAQRPFLILHPPSQPLDLVRLAVYPSSHFASLRSSSTTTRTFSLPRV
ncbi:hypothetical protein BCV70DRAFT_43470 [Testicularia cyperi]|uniref:Uncharacterized protein n=1 Tax=Testicularia cyperi TaxID=1882483 RepID=A0A317XJI5_9BASI|nr:hypothetical protein BCV70DRAFT_43470 [Testicularia cyperi]